MSEKYFEKFPKITYKGIASVDITRKAKFVESVKNNPYIYQIYTLNNSETASNITEAYYGDPYLDWLLYLANDIIDPYYNWYMPDEVFYEFIKLKYGSLDYPKNQVISYITNWTDGDVITISAYNDIAPSLKKYWIPEYINNRIVAYRRKPENLEVNTNMILKIEKNQSDLFDFDERVNIHILNNTIGYGQVLKSNTSSLTIQHIRNDAFPHDNIQLNSNSYVYGTISGANCTISNVSFVANNISLAEQAYWKPYTAYDREVEKNEYNKTLKILDSSLTAKTVFQIKESLK